MKIKLYGVSLHRVIEFIYSNLTSFFPTKSEMVKKFFKDKKKIVWEPAQYCRNLIKLVKRK